MPLGLLYPIMSFAGAALWCKRAISVVLKSAYDFENSLEFKLLSIEFESRLSILSGSVRSGIG